MNASSSVVWQKSQYEGQKWLLEDYHCPSCGERRVWRRDLDGVLIDYYTGDPHICTACGFVFNLYLPDKVGSEDPLLSFLVEHEREDAKKT